jgi:hypothetical protein
LDLCEKKKSRRVVALLDLHTLFVGCNSLCGILETALGAVIAQLERSALSLLGLANVVLAVADLDLVQSAVLILVISAAVNGALDAGVGLVDHDVFLLVFRIQGEYALRETELFHGSTDLFGCIR